MRLPTLDKNDPSKVDLEQLKQMVDLFLEKGFTYFDTAWMYNAFASEGAAKAALVDRHPRESFTLATKLHAGFFNSLEDRDKIFNAQLEKTGAGYFDYYLLHGIEGNVYDKFEQFDCFNWLLRKRPRSGKARGLLLPRRPGAAGQDPHQAPGDGVRPAADQLPGLGQPLDSLQGRV